MQVRYRGIAYSNSVSQPSFISPEVVLFRGRQCSDISISGAPQGLSPSEIRFFGRAMSPIDLQ